jgi:hypothetical protein
MLEDHQRRIVPGGTHHLQYPAAIAGEWMLDGFSVNRPHPTDLPFLLALVALQRFDLLYDFFLFG